MRVLIAGGGIGGLTAALALLKHGVDVDVYEQAAELKEVGAGVQLAANGTRVLYALGIGEELKTLSCETQGKEIRLWSTGQTWKLFDLAAESVKRYGYPYLMFHRGDLHRVLAQGVAVLKANAVRLKNGDLAASDAGHVVIGGAAPSGLPLSLQLAGRPFEEATVLRVGHAYEQATPWHTRRPRV